MTWFVTCPDLALAVHGYARHSAHTARLADPAVAAQVQALDAMLRRYHADKARRPVPDVSPERTLADLAAGVGAA